MNLFELLQNNKGTVSSALGKELAQKVLEGDRTILNDAIQYVSYDLENPKSKNIRAGAAKILEKVAEKQPELIADDLEKLKPALDVAEPQTRWMLMQVFGYCAKLNPKDASSVIDYGKSYLGENAGVCLSGAVHLYLGRVGATSEKTAAEVLPILDDALQKASENEVDWILEAFYSIIDKVGNEGKELIKRNAELYADAKKNATIKRVRKILKKIS
ncbi:MAG: hypothetical protein C0599_00330 [Salinivirgaceae bacterium]|nr:MAG: hypothetical protein C0599_00330 [Salinivirgaceae bacterium]